MMKIGFLSNDCLLTSETGGVQLCTQEFLSLFKAIDSRLTRIAYPTDQSIPGRLFRRLRPSPHQRLISRVHWHRCLQEIRGANVEVLLLNNSDAFALAPQLRRALPGLKLVYLSHGPVVTDVVNALRLPLPEIDGGRPSVAAPGKTLDQDILLRRHVHGTVSISESDDTMEAWLGSCSHVWFPRIIDFRPHTFRPVPGRVGCVSTLNHAPNYDGLVRLARAIDACSSVRLRLVGRAHGIGQKLAHEFACIDYLGPLDDEALANEIVSWRAFVNPVFCMARGCSMKVKTALERGLPVLTTPIGARGYVWDSNALHLSASATELAHQINCVAHDEDAYQAALAGAARIAACGESASTLVVRLKKFLRSL